MSDLVGSGRVTINLPAYRAAGAIYRQHYLMMPADSIAAVQPIGGRFVITCRLIG